MGEAVVKRPSESAAQVDGSVLGVEAYAAGAAEDAVASSEPVSYAGALVAAWTAGVVDGAVHGDDDTGGIGPAEEADVPGLDWHLGCRPRDWERM